MLCARDIMTLDPMTVSPETSIADAVRLLLEHGVNGLPVIDDGALVGIICQGDLVSLQKKFPLPSVFTLFDGFLPLRSQESVEREFRKIAAAKVADAMTADPVTISPDTHLEEIAALMSGKKFYTLPVVENGRLVGVVGKEDVLRTLVSEA